MQKINKISCCAECSAYVLKKEAISFCKKAKKSIKTDSNNYVNLALVGFPEWCPLDSLDFQGNIIINFKKEVKQIMEIMKNSSNSDALQDASQYLNSVLENAKNFKE